MATKAKTAAAVETDSRPRVEVKVAPKPRSSGEQVKLEPLQNRLVGLKVFNRSEVDTKFGRRSMSDVAIVSADSEPLFGVLFASYFNKELEPGEWYIGRIARTSKGHWFMDAPTGKDSAEIASLQDRMAEADAEADAVPF
jgi:hypothetical protein